MHAFAERVIVGRFSVRNSDPPPPRNQRSTDEVVEELCIALRKVGVATTFRPYGPGFPDVGGAVERVREVEAELQRRGVGFDERLARLTGETGWDMVALLSDCHDFPAAFPWVRSSGDGLRHALRCGCGVREFPPRDGALRFCDACLRELSEALRTKASTERFVVVRDPDANGGGSVPEYRLVPWDPTWDEEHAVGLTREEATAELARRAAG